MQISYVKVARQNEKEKIERGSESDRESNKKKM